MISISDWINSQFLVDLLLGGARFMWSNNQTPPILSQLDRILVSRDWIGPFSEVSQIALAKPVSNHCPTIIDSNYERWGPTPFRFELMWLEEPHFAGLIKDWWRSFIVEGRAFFRLSVKLKKLKEKIKEWVKDDYAEATVAKAKILEGIQKFDLKEEVCHLSVEELNRRIQLKERFLRKVREEEIK